MHLILIPLLIIAILVGIYEGGDIWNDLNLSFPSLGEDGLDVRQFLSSPGSPPDQESPLRQLGN